MSICCGAVNNIITGVWGGGDDPVVPEFLTFAMINDPVGSGSGNVFLDWTFVGFGGFNLCTFTPEFSTFFGYETGGCFDGSQTVGAFFNDWATTNGLIPGTESTFDRNQEPEINLYYINYFGDQAVLPPPDFQIFDTTPTAKPLTWVTVQPVTLTTTFNVDSMGDNPYIEALLYGYDYVTVYEMGSFNTTPIDDPAFPAYLLSKVTPTSKISIDVQIVGNQVTITIVNTFEQLRGIKWYNPITLASGTSNFTIV